MMAEAVVFGRAAMGEAMREGFFADRWRVKRGGTLIYADAQRFDGAIADKLARRAVTGGGIAIATVLVAPGGEEQLTRVRALDEQFMGEVGISAWNGIAVAALCRGWRQVAARSDCGSRRARYNVPRLWLQ